MTLFEYLKTNPVDDVKRLIDRYQGNTWPRGCDSSCDHALWSIESTGAWLRVEVAQIQIPRLTCYYLQSGNEFAISDLGENLSAIMRRTGQPPHEAIMTARKILFGSGSRYSQACGDVCLYLTAFDISTHCDSVDDLPIAIVAILSAVARVRGIS